MGIEVVPYTSDRVAEVREFNQRMHRGGVPWGWYERAEDDWIPKRPGQKVWREHYLAVEDGKTVRGAFALKPHEWYLRGVPTLVTDWQGPVSEGALSRKYNMLGLRLMREMLERYPLLYSWGHGDEGGPLLEMLESLRWLVHPTPFCLRIVKPFRFLRLNRYLRGSAGRRAALDALAFTGAGWLGLELLHGALSLRGGAPRDATVEVVPAFGAWADELWERCRGSYLAIALRDSASMNALLPDGGWPLGIRLRIRRGEQDVGWAVVMDNQLHADRRFGNMQVGTVVDCLALPEDAPSVVAAATRFLTRRGVDMICSNQAHPRWVEAFAASGHLILHGRRRFAASPELWGALQPFEEMQQGLHLTNMDGHGPHGL